MRHQSVLQLSRALVEYGVALSTFSAKRIVDWNSGDSDKPPLAGGFSLSDETYSKRSFVYIQAPDKELRKRLETFLDSKGFKYSTCYAPDGNTTEIRVAYFKGWHWND